MESSSALLLLAFIAAVAFISRIINRKPPTKLKHPPGPKPWPIIGNMHLIGSIPHQSLHYLSQKYGELMLLKFGKFPVVVAASPEMAKQFLKIYDTSFASRPALAAGKYTSFNYSDLTWAPYGPYWRQARKIYLTEVLNAKAIKTYEHVRMEERRTFFSRLHSLSGKSIVLREQLCRYTLSTMSNVIFGRLVFDSHEAKGGNAVKLDELQAMLDDWFFFGGALNLGDWIPWLNYIDPQGYVKRMKALNRKFDRFYTSVFSHHLANRDPSAPKIPLDSLLGMPGDPNLDVKLTEENVKGLLMDLLAGGTDTSATTVEWAVHELLRHPHVYSKVKEEIDRVVGRNRWVEEEDFPQLTYLDAVIKESMRLHPLATFLAPHCAMEDINIAGYDISKGTMILVNTWSLGRDPKVWDNPEKFSPERFLVEDIDILGSNFALLPFGSGRRRCPGYKLGLKLVRSTLSNLVHGFNWRLPEGMTVKDVCMEELYGLTTRPKISLEIILEPSLPLHLY